MIKHARPANNRHIGHRMKLHLRVRSYDGTTLRLLCLRPGLQVSMSTNRCHGTWHILGDARTAKLLSHLLWGLSFQTAPGTAILLHGAHLRPNPFDAEPSDPILLLPAHLTHPSAKAVRQLRRGLGRLGPSDRTIRWRSDAVDSAFDRSFWTHVDGRQERFDRIGGMLVYRAPPPVMRMTAVAFAREKSFQWWSTHADFAEHPHRDGELQLFKQYRSMVSTAKVARSELLNEGVDVHAHAEAVWRRQDEVTARRARANQK